MKIRWNQIAIAVAAGFLMGAFFSDYYHMHIKRRPPQQMQQRPPRAGKDAAAGPIEQLTHDLELSDQQEAKVSAIFSKYRPEVKKARARLEELRLQIMTELKAALTAKQYAKLEEPDKNTGPGNGPPPPRPDQERPERQ